MCGRYALHSLLDELQRHFQLFDTVAYAPRFNVPPSLRMPVVRSQGAKRELALCQWGFVPGWMKSEPRSRPINARAETASEKPYFRAAMRRGRCLVPANGFYEWTHASAPKQPWYFRRANSDLMAFAGLWDTWDSGGERIESFAILTTSANDTLRPVHDRMPVILDPKHYDDWLQQGGTDLLVPYAGSMTGYPVGKAVNATVNDGPGLVAPL